MLTPETTAPHPTRTVEINRDDFEHLAFTLGAPIDLPDTEGGWVYLRLPHGTTLRAWLPAAGGQR